MWSMNAYASSEVCDYFLYLETYVIVLKVIFTLFVHNRYKETGNVFRPRTCFTDVKKQLVPKGFI